MENPPQANGTRAIGHRAKNEIQGSFPLPFAFAQGQDDEWGTAALNLPTTCEEMWDTADLDAHYVRFPHLAKSPPDMGHPCCRIATSF